MKKLSKLIFVVTMLASILVSPLSLTAKAQEAVELLVWVQYSQESAEGQAMTESVEKFNAENESGIVVNVEYIPRSGAGGGYEDKINAALTTNTLPDVLTLDGPNTAAYADARMIQPLDDFLTITDDILPSIIEQGTYDGSLYAMGYSESGVGIYYNKDMFAEAGITEDQLPTLEDPWTWDEFIEISRTLRDTFDVPAINLGLDDHSEWLMYAFAPFIWSNGGEIVSEDGTNALGVFDSPENVETFTFLQTLSAEGLTTLTPAEMAFQTGQYPMLMSGSWTIQELENEYQDINYGVLPYPVSPNTEDLVSPTGSWAYGMSSTTEHPEAAGELIDFLASEDEMYRMSMMNTVLPARHSVAERMIAEVDEPMSALIEQNQISGRARPVLVNYPLVTRAVQEAVIESAYHEVTTDIQAMLTQKAEQIQNALN